MDQILELATKLGKLMAADPRAVKMNEARRALQDSPEDRRLLEDYQNAQDKIRELESQQKPIEPEDKKRLASLHSGVTSSPVMKALLKAQVDYAELMGAVSQRIEEATAGYAGTP